MDDTLEQALSDALGEVPLIRRHGGTLPVDTYAQIIARIAAAAEPFTAWLGEKDAALHAGRSAEWLRTRFPAWERAGHARKGHKGAREYREAVLPRRLDLDAVRADAARTAQGTREAA